MRIVSWNMDYWKKRGAETQRAAWAFLCDELHPDVALLQESVAPPDVNAVRREQGIYPSQPWNSMVVVFNGDHEPFWEVQTEYRGHLNAPVAIDASFPGTVAATRLSNGVTVVSAYGLGVNGYSSTTMLHILADLEHLHDDIQGRGKKVILAGDWNIGSWWSGKDVKYRDRDRSILGLLEGRGMIDCIDRHLPADRGRLAECRCTYADDCRHVWTYKSALHPTIAYQDDYMYASASVIGSLTHAQVWDYAAVWARDHQPLVADFDL